MKKYFSILIATGFILASCGGNSNTTATTETAADSVETVATEEVEPAVDPAKALADYKEYVDKFEKVAAGVNKKDGKAMIEYSKLLKQDSAIRSLLQKASTEFTEEQQKEYKKLVERYTASVKLITPEK